MSNDLEPKKQEEGETASPKAEADAKVGTALSQRGHGEHHESGATFHNDATSHAAADAVGARAFTAGNDVYFGAGQHSPGTASGNSLIQHELAHVEQARGVTAPEAGNFAVSETSDAAEVGARDGSGSGSAAPATIYRDPTPTGGPPATTGTGAAGGTPPPAEGGTPAVDAISGGSTPEQLYTEWKETVQRFNSADAITKWAALAAESKVKFKTEGATFQHRVIYVMKKDSVKVFKDGGVNLIANNHAYSIFLKDDFAAWLPELRSALFLTPFLNAEPLRTHIDQPQALKLKTWIDAATSVTEAKAIFHKVYPTLHDTSTATWGTAVAWPLNRIQQLFGVLAQYLNAGHASTVTGGFVYVTGAGFGWWNSGSKRVWLPDSSNGMGHNMTGGSARGISRTEGVDAAGKYTAGHTGRSVSRDYTGADGTAHTGQAAGIGHMVGTILHEVGHGVGDQLDGGRGNRYAENSASYPGFNKISLDSTANALWTSGANGAGAEPAVHKNAKLDDAHAKEFFKTELASGKGSYSPGWTGNPPRADMATYCKWKYAAVPLQKFWDFFVERGHPKADSYAWDEEGARIPAGSSWVYGYLERGGMGWTKYKKAAWDAKVSWYSLSSPKEWFAEQYTHFYRTEKTGSGIDPTTLALLKDLDKKDFVPTTGTEGVTIGGSSAATGEGAAATATGATAPTPGAEGPRPAGPTPEGPDRPLFFPWN